MHDAIQERIQAYQKEIGRRLAEMERLDCEGKQAPPLKNKNKAKMIRQRGEEPMRQAFYRVSGVDLTAIDAVGVGVVQVVLHRIRHRSKLFSNGETLRLAHDARTLQGRQRRQAVKEEETRQRQQPCVGGAALGSIIPAP